MRMRKKPNLVPRMERCAALLETQPQQLRGRWLQERPAFGELRLELGCGKGRFTADLAEQNPQTLLVAVEKVQDAMVVAMERVHERGLENVRFLDMDAVHVTEVFAPGEVSRIYINFPDPWLKTKQYKRRLTAPSFLRLYALECVTRDRHANGPVGVMTDYEAKFHEQGVKICHCLAVRPEHPTAPSPAERESPAPAEAQEA